MKHHASIPVIPIMAMRVPLGSRPMHLDIALNFRTVRSLQHRVPEIGS